MQVVRGCALPQEGFQARRTAGSNQLTIPSPTRRILSMAHLNTIGLSFFYLIKIVHISIQSDTYLVLIIQRELSF